MRSSRNVEYMTCLICGKQAKNISQHLYYSHTYLNAQQYYNKYIKQGTEEICPICAKNNNLNYIVLWNKKDLDNFIKSYKI